MNRDDVIQMLTVLKAAYPQSFQVGGKPMKQMDAEALISLWERQFAEEDPTAVSAAVENLIATRTVGFSPTVGEVKDQLHRLRTVGGLNDGQAWYLVEKACRRGLYNAKEEFDKLPPDVQAAVGGPEQLKAWAAMDAETVNSVVASNFRKTYRTVKEREKEKALMPPEVKAFVAGIAGKMQLGSGQAEQKAIEAKKPAALPAAFQPMTGTTERPEIQRREVVAVPAGYEPLLEDDWERRRNEMLRMLKTAGGTA